MQLKSGGADGGAVAVYYVAGSWMGDNPER